MPDSGGVVFVPALTGLGAPHWDPDARGAIVGITRGTTRAHLARATLEAIAFEVRDVVEVMTAEAGLSVPELTVDGGASGQRPALLAAGDRARRAGRAARRSWRPPAWAPPSWPASAPGSGARARSWPTPGAWTAVSTPALATTPATPAGAKPSAVPKGGPPSAAEWPNPRGTSSLAGACQPAGGGCAPPRADTSHLRDVIPSQMTGPQIRANRSARSACATSVFPPEHSPAGHRRVPYRLRI